MVWASLLCEFFTAMLFGDCCKSFFDVSSLRAHVIFLISRKVSNKNRPKN